MKRVKNHLRDRLSKNATAMHQKLFPSSQLNYQIFWEAYPERRVDANAIILGALLDTQPFLAARFGNTELEIAQQWRRRTRPSSPRLSNFIEAFATGDPYFVWVRSRRRIKALGINPLGPAQLEGFGGLMASAMQEIDLLGSWVGGEPMFCEFLEGASVDRLHNFEHYRFEKPWTNALEGKRVLVVHPFARSIQDQFSNHREKLFPEGKNLPEFDLVTLVPPRAHHNEIGNADEWFSALSDTINRSMDINFDIAIVGAGPFGLPLAAALKKNGKRVVHLGGATQLLFGIMGARWEAHPLIASFRNRYWIRPNSSETPPMAARKLSQESYW